VDPAAHFAASVIFHPDRREGIVALLMAKKPSDIVFRILYCDANAMDGQAAYKLQKLRVGAITARVYSSNNNSFINILSIMPTA
jgi:hypothetical protein